MFSILFINIPFIFKYLNIILKHFFFKYNISFKIKYILHLKKTNLKYLYYLVGGFSKSVLYKIFKIFEYKTQMITNN